MKKSILALAAVTFISGVVLTSCDTPAEKVESAQKNVSEANKNFEEANEE